LTAPALPAAADEDVIKLGGLAPLSSPGSYQQGAELVLGLQWAVDDVNAAGGLLGKKVELIIEDTQGKPPTGAIAAEKLVTKDKVVGVAGEYHSSVCTAEIEVFHRAGMPFVIGSCWSDTLTEAGYDEIFRTSVYSSKLAENMVALIMKNGIKKVAALVEDTDYGVGIAKNIEKSIVKLGGDFDFSYEVVEKTSKDFVPILLKYKTREKPEMVIVAVTQPGGFLVLKQAHEIGFAPSKQTLYLDATCTAQNDEVFWAAVKGAGQYVLMSCPERPTHGARRKDQGALREGVRPPAQLPAAPGLRRHAGADHGDQERQLDGRQGDHRGVERPEDPRHPWRNQVRARERGLAQPVEGRAHLHLPVFGS
jgi:branched-chain amino acid transport system substrate-binding protein